MFITVLLAAVFLITGCNGDTQQTTGGGAFIGGTQGMVATFEPLSIKEGDVYTIFDSEDFPLEIKLKNKGEETLAIGKATLRLLGPPPGDFQNIPQWELHNRQQIEKVSEFNPEGGEEIVSFTPTAYGKYTAQVTGFTDINWNLEYWYDYKTHLIVNDVCFKGDITDPKVCEVKQDKTFSVSGAPVTVTGVSEDSAGRGIILLKIDIENKGTGTSTSIGQDFDDRFSQLSYSIDEAAKWECKSGGRENEARLIDGKAQIICRLKDPIAEEDIFTKSVRVTFDYTYKELIQEKLRVKESAE